MFKNKKLKKNILKILGQQFLEKMNPFTCEFFKNIYFLFHDFYIIPNYY